MKRTGTLSARFSGSRPSRGPSGHRMTTPTRAGLTIPSAAPARVDEILRHKVSEGSMPRYEFFCEKCKKPFELAMTISEREKAKPQCPTCKGAAVTPQFAGFVAQTRKKS
jgi:putative FmdB family regulatory protein